MPKSRVRLAVKNPGRLNRVVKEKFGKDRFTDLNMDEIEELAELLIQRFGQQKAVGMANTLSAFFKNRPGPTKMRADALRKAVADARENA